jgi:hypothetical protein
MYVVSDEETFLRSASGASFSMARRSRRARRALKPMPPSRKQKLKISHRKEGTDAVAPPRAIAIGRNEGASHAPKRAGAAAALGIKAHAHMLRRACGFKLANDGIDTPSLQPTSGIAISKIRPATRRWRRGDLRTSGGISST